MSEFEKFSFDDPAEEEARADDEIRLLEEKLRAVPGATITERLTAPFARRALAGELNRKIEEKKLKHLRADSRRSDGRMAA